jgi:diaminopimelate decarboxylase
MPKNKISFLKLDKLRTMQMKALSNVAVLQLLKEMGAGLDTVSIQEVQLGLHAGYEPEKIFYTPNGVSLEEIEEVNAMGVQINIDNLSILEQFGTKHPNVPVCISIRM